MTLLRMAGSVVLMLAEAISHFPTVRFYQNEGRTTVRVYWYGLLVCSI